MSPRHPHVRVELPDGADHGTIVTTVAAALRDAGADGDAATFEIEAAATDLAGVTRRVREWVDVDWDRAAPATATAAPTTSTGSVVGPAMPGATRWQYAVVDVGSFNTADRMAQTLGEAGRHGWELVGVYDKASNWVHGFEKGYLMLKRPVPDGVTPATWCTTIRQ